jgi:putative FmdB family regulatory protein
MATYEYSCSRCGPFEVRLPIGTAPASYGCPVCATASRRVFSAPGLSSTSEAVSTLVERQEQSREAPDVVSEVPLRAGAAPHRPHPALSRLPRP